MFWRRICAFGFAIALAATAQAAKPQVWVPAWIASPAPDRRDGPPDAPLQFDRQTVRQDMRLGTSAQALRFRISNELGDAPLVLGGASARIVGDAVPALPVLFDGRNEVVVPVGAALLSDPVALSAPAFADVSLNLYYPQPTRAAVRRTPLRVADGNVHVDDSVPLSYRQNAVSMVLALRERDPVVVVALGDSITEGATAARGTHGDWPARDRKSVV